MVDFSSGILETQLPYYLPGDKKKALIRALEQFPDNVHYCETGFEKERLQGDMWTGFQLVNFSTAQFKGVRGVVVSNSCDISDENDRRCAGNIIFAPVISLDRYLKKLADLQVEPATVASIEASIRLQHVSDIFYLPKCQLLDEDMVVLFEQIQSMPLDALGKTDSTKILQLTNVGFYLFVFKLSFHFCRLHEEVVRG